jgi:outer membrane protein assembly factor BamB
VAGFVRGLDRATGRRVWEVQVVENAHPIAAQIHQGIALAIAEPQGLVFASAYGDRLLFCIEYATGTVRWYADLERVGRKTLLVDGDQLFVGLIRTVRCYGLRGALQWEDAAEGGGAGVVALGVPGNVQQADQG